MLMYLPTPPQDGMCVSVYVCVYIYIYIYIYTNPLTWSTSVIDSNLCGNLSGGCGRKVRDFF